MKINCHNDTINTFGENITLINTTSSHYDIPQTSVKQTVNNIDGINNSVITLALNKSMNNQTKQ